MAQAQTLWATRAYRELEGSGALGQSVTVAIGTSSRSHNVYERAVHDEDQPIETDAPTLVILDRTARPLLLVDANRARFKLTRREWEICQSLSRGVSVRAIASELQMSVATVRAHLRAAFAKTGTGRQLDLLLVLSADD